MSKTICIYHSRDLDGWMSAAIVKHWFDKENNGDYIEYEWFPKENRIESIYKGGFNDIKLKYPSIAFLGWDYGDDIPDLKDYDKVIMVDISFPAEKMLKLQDKLIWIDHHISAIKNMEKYMLNNSKNGDSIKGRLDTNYAACELTWKYFFPNEDMPEIVRLLGRYDCFGYKSTSEEQKVLEFQYGARAFMSGYNDCYDFTFGNRVLSNNSSNDYMLHFHGKTIYKYLCTEAKQTYSKAFPIKLSYGKTRAIGPSEMKKDFKFLCVNQERFNPINFGINYHKDGYDGFMCFWYKDGKWSFSLYNNNGEVDCSAIAKQYGGGGHKGAAGFVIKDLKEIIK